MIVNFFAIKWAGNALGNLTTFERISGLVDNSIDNPAYLGGVRIEKVLPLPGDHGASV